MTWHQWDDYLRLLARRLLAEWNCALPPHDTLPSEHLEYAVSAWCMLIAKHIDGELPETPPEIIRPWLLARIVYANTLANILSQKADQDPPELCEKSVRHLLIGEWHGAGRDWWPLALKLDE